MPDRPAEPAHLPVLGVPVTAFESYRHAVDWIGQRIERSVPTFCVAINPEKVFRAARDARLRRALMDAEARLCDGIGVSLAAWLLHGRRIARCTGCDLFTHLLEAASGRGWSVFMLGGSARSNQRAVELLKRRYPSLRVAGHRDGFFDDPAAVVRQINDSGADVLFVALGSPGQELFIHRHRADIRATLTMGVGGTLDVISGTARRAPAAFRRTGTEFLYRLLSDPRRWRRQLALPRFAWQVLLAWAGGRRRQANPQQEDD